MDEVIRIIRTHCESQFPRRCSRCGRCYDSYAQYLRETTPVGAPVSFDAEASDWRPEEPLGGFALSNCPCGTTLALGTAGMATRDLWRLMGWLRFATLRSNRTPPDVLLELRMRIREEVLESSGSAPTNRQATT